MNLTTENIVFLLAILLLAGILTTRFSAKLGVPSLVLYVIVGMFLNNFIYFDNVYFAQLGAILALIVILFEGGMQTSWDHARPIILPAFTLATLGVLITALSIGAFAKFILDISWLEGMLFGAIVGSTDAAAVFAVLGDKNINHKLKITLQTESGSNDPMAMFLTISFIQLIKTPSLNLSDIVFSFFWQMGFGLVVGIIIGKIAVWSINKINLESSGLYPILALSFAILAFGSTALLGGSGILAVYVAGIWLGNSDLTYRQPIFRFHEGFAWMAQILMFILLGLLVFPHDLLGIVWQGIIISILLIFVARPLGVFLCTTKMGFALKDKLFISWSGLRGAVPIVLGTYPMAAGLDNSQLIFNVVFFVVFTSALVQGSTISPLAEFLGLTENKKIPAAHILEMVSMGKTKAEFIEILIEEESKALNMYITDLNLPEDALITAIIRKNKVITPRGKTKILLGDTLYVLAPKNKREIVKRNILTDEDTIEKNREGLV